jgi:hypothetical protein
LQTPTDISEENSNEDVIVFPNPASGELNVKTENMEGLNEISIYDLQGRVVLTQKANRNTAIQKLNITSLVKGLYFIELKSDKDRTTKKLIKN